MNIISDRLTSEVLQGQLKQFEDDIFLEKGGEFLVIDVAESRYNTKVPYLQPVEN